MGVVNEKTHLLISVGCDSERPLLTELIRYLFVVHKDQGLVSCSDPIQYAALLSGEVVLILVRSNFGILIFQE